jgi:hypothetical protein
MLWRVGRQRGHADHKQPCLNPTKHHPRHHRHDLWQLSATRQCSARAGRRCGAGRRQPRHQQRQRPPLADRSERDAHRRHHGGGLRSERQSCCALTHIQSISSPCNASLRSASSPLIPQPLNPRDDRMKPTPIIRLFTTLAVAASLSSAACSRDLPSEWPESSPASSSATEVPAAKVTLALDGDPPLPGESAEGWIGLEPANNKPAKHEGHGGGHHHGH